MKVRKASIIIALSGKLGGVHVQGGPSGSVLSMSPKGKSGNTKGQERARGLTKSFSQNWRHLTDTERKTWLYYEPLNISGIQLFIAVNQVRASIGLPVLIRSAPPTTQTVFPSFSYKIPESYNSLKATPEFPVSFDGYTIFRASSGRSRGATTERGGKRIIKIIPTALFAPVSLYADYIQVYGSFVQNPQTINLNVSYYSKEGYFLVNNGSRNAEITQVVTDIAYYLNDNNQVFITDDVNTVITSDINPI